MKLRILNNTIRFRLSMSDLNELNERGSIVEDLNFGLGKSFSYGIQKSDQESIFTLDRKHDGLVLNVQSQAIAKLFETNEIGIYDEIKEKEMPSLKISIEKDFKCLTPRSEDESDLYPNPREHH